MNRDEKNLQTRQKIIDSALLEFSQKSYGEASLNTVCAAGNISKGIIYHYFKDKDELYLICIKECFDALTAYLASHLDISSVPVEKALENYFDARIAFWGAHPAYLNLFCNVVIFPPAHLESSISEIKAEFDALSLFILNKLIGGVKLCPDVTQEEVVDIFREYQDFISTRFQTQTFNEVTLKQYEMRCRRSLKVLLYGVIEREEL